MKFNTRWQSTGWQSTGWFALSFHGVPLDPERP
jgi:hypothetical protein